MDDSVWESIPPGTGRLPRRVSRGLLLLATALLVALAVAGMLSMHGAFGARITIVPYGWAGEFVEANGQARPAIGSADFKPGPVVRLTVEVQNTGWSHVRVVDVRLVGAGFLELGWSSEDRTGPVKLLAGRSLPLSLTVRITDCVTADAVRVAITIDSWRGEQTADLALPVVAHLNGGWHVTTSADPAAISSVRYLADEVCPLA